GSGTWVLTRAHGYARLGRSVGRSLLIDGMVRRNASVRSGSEGGKSIVLEMVSRSDERMNGPDELSLINQLGKLVDRRRIMDFDHWASSQARTSSPRSSSFRSGLK